MNQHPSPNSGFIIPRAILASLLFASAGLLAFASFAGLTPSLGSASSAVLTQTQPPFTPIENKVSVGGLNLLAKTLATAGKVKPGETFPIVLSYRAGAAPVTNATITVTLHNASIFQNSTPTASSGNGTSGSPLTYTLPLVAANSGGDIVIEARAKDLTEDPEVMWKDVSADVTLAAGGQGPAPAKTHGPKVTSLESAVFGDRPFPVVMVQYQDVRRCVGEGLRANPIPGGPPIEAIDCAADHPSQLLDEAVNSRTTGKSVFQLFQDMSFGQLYPDGRVSPAPASPQTPYNVTYQHKFSTPAPGGTCTGTTTGPAYGPAFAVRNRIENGWYLLPGDQRYYGQDRTGHALAGALTGQGLLFGIDDACGPTGKITYDAASLADPDIDYNDFDTDKDGVVDFFNLVFAGDGGNGSTTPSGLSNVWPHSSDLRFYFTDASGLSGYVSNDQFRNRLNQLMYYTSASRTEMTTTVTAFPVYVRVGPYNVNPESAIDSVSVIAHEYGHSLGLPDFYSTGTRGTYGSWELMGSDHFQYMTVFSRQDMGWIVPKPLPSGQVTLTESKFDTGEIQWTRPDGTPYTLTGPGIHNADVYRLQLPPRVLIDSVPSGVRAWYSQAGNDFGCATDGGGHNLDFFIPDLQQHGSASSVTLKFKSFYEIEWDYDYGFVLVSEDGGNTWTSLPSQNGTTTNAFNPNANGCQTTYNNGITGVSDGDPSNDTVKRATADYSGATFIEDRYDLTAYKGKNIILRFSYSTDPGLAKRGWFIDDIEITAGSTVVYKSDFEQSQETTRIFPDEWVRVSSADGSPADHAYYLELRDRISNDFDGKGQSDRGNPSWEGGVSMIYTDEAHGYGNFGVDDPPAQTPVDSNPQPGNATPNLDDAAFTLARPEFNSCAHIDNYSNPNGPDGLWKLPGSLKFNVTALNGMSPGAAVPASPATASMIVDLEPNCSLQILAPTLSDPPANYENPDTDGSYQLSWTRPPAAVGPDLLQISAGCGPFFNENADDISDWNATTEGNFVGLTWQTVNNEKPEHAGTTFRTKASFGGVTPGPNANASSILTYKNPITVPASGITTLTWQDWNVNEGDDGVFVEVSDDGNTWNVVYSNSRSALAPDAAVAFAEESLFPRAVDLSNFAGKTIRLRYRYTTGGENRAGSEPFGWYVDNIQIANADWLDLAATSATSFTEQRPSGNYCYRVRTTYLAGGQPILASPFSNVVSVNVAEGVFRAVSRKMHGSGQTAPAFDLDLPLTGNPGIESRRGGGPAFDTHQVVLLFGQPVNFTGASVTPQSGKNAQVASTSGNGTTEVVVNLANVSEAQTLTVNLTGVSGAGTAANISVPMGVLPGDVNATRRVDGNDVSAVQARTRQTVNNSNFQADVNTTGLIDGNDVSAVQGKTRTRLP